jgi:putative membrane protein
MSEPLKPARRFDQPAAAEPAPALAQPRQFDADLPIVERALDAADGETALIDELRRPRRRFGLLALFTGTALLGGVELVLSLGDAWRQSDWLGAGWSGLALLAIGLGAATLTRELWRLRQLRRHAGLRARVGQHWHSETIGDSRALCEQLRRDSGIGSDDERWRNFCAGDQAFHTDGERLQRYAIHVLSPSDARARALIARAAGESALLVAASPLAWVDMALLAWRSLRLLDRISALYGLRLGYAARLRLFRSVLANMAFAGAGELASDAAADALALGLAGRLSTRLAQGLGAGLLTARLGLKALLLCRPLPFDEGNAPRLSEIRSQLLQELNALGKKAGAAADDRQQR